MVNRRSVHTEATLTGPFAAVYWAVWGVALGLAIAAFAWGSAEDQRVTGYIVMSVVIAQIVARQVVVRRIERHREAERVRLHE